MSNLAIHHKFASQICQILALAKHLEKDRITVGQHLTSIWQQRPIVYNIWQLCLTNRTDCQLLMKSLSLERWKNAESCRSLKMLQHEYNSFIFSGQKIVFDIAESDPIKVCQRGLTPSSYSACAPSSQPRRRRCWQHSLPWDRLPRFASVKMKHKLHNNIP